MPSDEAETPLTGSIIIIIEYEQQTLHYVLTFFTAVIHVFVAALTINLPFTFPA